MMECAIASQDMKESSVKHEHAQTTAHSMGSVKRTTPASATQDGPVTTVHSMLVPETALIMGIASMEHAIARFDHSHRYHFILLFSSLLFLILLLLLLLLLWLLCYVSSGGLVWKGLSEQRMSQRVQ